MASKMNSKTHKVISAYYTKETVYAVPIEWDIEDIIIQNETIYYKGEEQDDIQNTSEELEYDSKYPDRIEEGKLDLEDFFDCEDEEKGCVKCCSCDEAEATHKVFRDALGEYEHTCDKCFKKEYEEEEEVRCVCPKCFAEGHTFVSKARAKELEEMEEMEEMCPFGEKCNGE